MAEFDDRNVMQEYLQQINHELEKGTWLMHTGNTVIDAILSSKLSRVQQNDIEFTHTIFLPKGIPLGNLELTSLLGNLMDNAIEACEQLKKENIEVKRYIHLEIKPYNQFLFLEISNSSAGIYYYNTFHRLISTKKELGHGIGLKRIEKIVSQVDGFLELTPENNSFYVSILIPLLKDSKESPEIKEKGDTQ